MDRGQNGRDEFFGGSDPFAGFGGFGPQRSMIPSFFGGRDPFDDPFFTQPFGGRMMGGPGMFGPSLFGPMGGPFGDMRNDGFIDQAPPRSNGRRPVITEVDEEEGENVERDNEQGNHGSYVQEPDDESDGMQNGQVQLRRDFSKANGGQPQARTFTYQSSSVTYGGINGAYYTASKTRRSGSDGITVEESKEADTTTKEATHKISRGIHDKGHSLTRKLKSDGKVDTTQILHNLNQDELAGFEKSWKGNAGHQLPGWNQNAGAPNNDDSGKQCIIYGISAIYLVNKGVALFRKYILIIVVMASPYRRHIAVAATWLSPRGRHNFGVYGVRHIAVASRGDDMATYGDDMATCGDLWR